MATHRLSPLGSSCWRCWSQGWARHGLSQPQPHQQLRGKKKLAAQGASTVKVRLLQDVVKYGRQGAIVPVAAGRMRNDWFPRRVAEYVTQVQLRELNLKEASFDRDITFGMVQETPEQEEHPIEVPEVAVELLSPDRAMELLSERLPPIMEFYRTPILPTHSASPASGMASSTVGQSTAEPSETAAIYGSVSTADIANSVKALLAQDEEGSRVVVAPENVRFVYVEGNANENQAEEDVGETDRVKRLGFFHVRIQIKEDSKSIQRLVRVSAQASDPAMVKDPTAI